MGLRQQATAPILSNPVNPVKNHPDAKGWARGGPLRPTSIRCDKLAVAAAPELRSVEVPRSEAVRTKSQKRVVSLTKHEGCPRTTLVFCHLARVKHIEVAGRDRQVSWQLQTRAKRSVDRSVQP